MIITVKISAWVVVIIFIANVIMSFKRKKTRREKIWIIIALITVTIQAFLITFVYKY